jgi:hypothetical protein
MCGVLLLGTLALQSVASPAYADRSCESPHCYSIARYSASGITGMWGDIQQNYTSIGTGYGDTLAHINSETWLLMSNGAWLEAGLRNGSDVGAYNGGCYCVAYDTFWEDATSSRTQFEHIIGHTTPNGAWDSFEFDHTSGSNWNFYFNGNYNSYSSATGSSSGNYEEVGGEYQNRSCVAGAGWANNFDIYTAVLINGSWIQPAWNQDNYIDSGCGFEGIHYSNGEYSWQKHAP